MLAVRRTKALRPGLRLDFAGGLGYKGMYNDVQIFRE